METSHADHRSARACAPHHRGRPAGRAKSDQRRRRPVMGTLHERTRAGPAPAPPSAGAGRRRDAGPAQPHGRRHRLRALRDDHAVPADGRPAVRGGAHRHAGRHPAHGQFAGVRAHGAAARARGRRRLEREGSRHERHGHLRGRGTAGGRAADRPLPEPVHRPDLFRGADLRPARPHDGRARREQQFDPGAAASARAAGHDRPHDREPADGHAIPRCASDPFPQPPRVRLHAA